MPKGGHNFIDRTGEFYGDLKVVRKGQSVASGASWICRCVCGTELSVSASNLKKGVSSCPACASARNREDFTDQRFGRLLVKEFAGSKLSKALWRCMCDCGTETIVRAQSLKTGSTTSCGCYGLERRISKVITHGMTNHPIYDVWISMKQRCFNERHKHYDRYGARGITVCERWLNFDNFRDDMLPTWQKGLTIERKDPNGNYEPGNCEWATRQRQSRNKEKTIKVDLYGREMTLPEIAEEYNLNQHTLWYRWKNGKRGDDLVKAAR